MLSIWIRSSGCSSHVVDLANTGRFRIDVAGLVEHDGICTHQVSDAGGVETAARRTISPAGLPQLVQDVGVLVRPPV